MTTMKDHNAKSAKLIAIRACESPTPLTLAHTPQSLPAELILSIADYMLEDDILCLSLCTRYLSAVLGNRRERICESRARLQDHRGSSQCQEIEHRHYRRRPYIRRFRGPRENFIFLRRLERDLPNQYACANCLCFMSMMDQSLFFDWEYQDLGILGLAGLLIFSWYIRVVNLCGWCVHILRAEPAGSCTECLEVAEGDAFAAGWNALLLSPLVANQEPAFYGWCFYF